VPISIFSPAVVFAVDLAVLFVGALGLLRPRRPPLASPRANPSAAFDFPSLSHSF